MSDLLYVSEYTYYTVADPVTPLWKCVHRSLAFPLF